MNNNSYKITGAILLGSIVFLGANTSNAFLGRMAYPIWAGTQFKSDNNSKTLMIFDKKEYKEIIVFKPEFTGNAKDFGIIFPTPALPEIASAPKQIFNELEQETNQPRYGIMPVYSIMNNKAEMAPAVKRVEIIEVKNVGQYTSIVIKANDARALSDWLTTYQFNYDAATKSALAFYVKQSGSYFTLLRVTVPAWEDRLKEATKVKTGTLDPISISFKTTRPMLPWRVMAGQLPLSKMTLYTISDDAYYVPHTDIQYAGIITKPTPASYAPETKKEDMSYGDVYNVNNMMLLRHAIVFNPKKITQDLYFTKGTRNIDLIPAYSKTAVSINAPMAGGLGIIQSKAKLFSPKGAYNGFLHTEIMLEKGNKGEMVRGLQEFLVGQNILVYKKGMKPNGVFDQKTEDALVLFQLNNGLTQTGVTDTDTKTFILNLLRQTNYPPMYY